MRSIDGVRDLKDITTLLTYLYMDEDKTITYNNGLTDLRIRMDNNFNIWSTNLKFPDLPDMKFNEQMTIPYMLGVINILKHTDPTEFPGSFKSRWDEIHTQVGTMMALNRDKFKLPRAERIKAIKECELIKEQGYPDQIDGKCLGFQKSEENDEPCEKCKVCKFNLYYED